MRDRGEGSDGGWILVFRKKAWKTRNSQDIHTVFVDNLPESLDPKGLYTLFSKFGVVVDVYIPNRRRKVTSSQFGFVRYNYSAATGVAIQKAHGTWRDNREIKVKMAEFSKAQSKNGKQQVLHKGEATTTH
ncbi:serine/arginine-rich splicing factor SC35-like [Camellia sinensis]|uniref:serine/arginine-rich splicing factor SC35-like n=1 Tax=Camellia sinensis TaxID=4442 RepID=UPI0010361879|nr:serine/arginine-rich splicing factor SC35-like [Camellia sinensis]